MTQSIDLYQLSLLKRGTIPFTREMSKVRSLVRPPRKAFKIKGFSRFWDRRHPAVVGNSRQNQAATRGENPGNFVRARLRVGAEDHEATSIA